MAQTGSGRKRSELPPIVFFRDRWRFRIKIPSKVADDVFETLMTIAKTEGGLSHAEAVAFFQQMQAENRYVMDVWGVLLNFQKALADVQEAKYSQGERWLKRVSATSAS